MIHIIRLGLREIAAAERCCCRTLLLQNLASAEHGFRRTWISPSTLNRWPAFGAQRSAGVLGLALTEKSVGECWFSVD